MLLRLPKKIQRICSVLTFNFQLFDVEIKYGLLQLCEGLAFLHDSVKLLHRNISPESIILNHQGAWKIFGFDFCLQNTQPNGVNPNWDFPLNDAMASDALRYYIADFLEIILC